ncbi:ATP-dependent (S)-NAD(P)H-hydrate dehydratase-like [Stegodyphus dumicola]|uniref:ATP-dependent (S)-NAD(P)H-hydrate dehydratase-like n=1 Tax=Stegodyphus dumicola TaxID=202533 RepID=UPI0015A7B02C|nr:ATP-dependent (S)-NAD(P)H-hydrate dehydratase-like [Stegodyphus dumicola]
MNPDLKAEVELIIPILSNKSHKGLDGRIGVIGGSKNYTGAPYFAAISALKTGCDLAHVFCTKDASPVIKSYSPELIVHPILDSPNFIEEISGHLPYLHSLVIGPGLGREESIFESTRELIKLAKESKLPIVFDADALFLLKNTPDCIAGYKNAILTPNKVEFGRLYSAVSNEQIEHDFTDKHVAQVAKLLGNVTIVKKGLVDVISDGIDTIVCAEEGSPRRCGGQGDLLSGSLGVFNFWAQNYSKRQSKPGNLSCNATIIAALGACMLTRRCNKLAFQKFQRSTLTSDMVSEIHNAFSSLFPALT